MSHTETRVLFVAGAGCTAFEDYPKTCDKLQQAGFNIAAITPDWENPSFEGLVEQVTHTIRQELNNRIGRATLVIAHSRGANVVMPALVGQSNIGAIIASPSMTCAEGYEDATAREFAEARFPGQALHVKHVGMRALAQASNIPTRHVTVMVGKQEVAEYPFMDDIAQATAQGFGVDLLRIPEAPHFIDQHDAYIDAVAAEATRIAMAL